MDSVLEFKTQTFGKWIFSGEHAVLRGGPALVFPLFQKKLVLEYQSGGQSYKPLNVQATGENAEDILRLFPDVLAKALSLLNKKNEFIYGTIRFTNELPLGSGMGASSSLCVAFSRWFHFLGFLKEDDIYEFARQLENIFHGESSGVDIAVVLHEKPLVFRRPNHIELLNITNHFKLYLSHTQQKGITKDCVAKVNQFIETNPAAGKRVDNKMIQTTLDAIKIFRDAEKNEMNKDSDLVAVLNSGYECFKEWGLTEGRVDSHIDRLKELGAVAAKPTGSGGGGYVLSLWPVNISVSSEFAMIPLFVDR